jgi:hypothetical protein
MKCRKALTWIQTYHRKFSFQQRRQAYVSFVQSLMDYHLLPTWTRMTKHHKLQWTRVTYRAARMIVGVSGTVSASIACREAGLLPPAHGFRYLWFKRALRCRRFESKIQQSIYGKSLEKLGLSEFSVMSERLPLSSTLAALCARLNQELLDEYGQVSPTRAYFLEVPPPTKLTKASCAVFQLRTESAKTKDWRWRHNQPLDDEPFNCTCRLCKRASGN